MTKEDILNIASKIFGLYLIIRMITQVEIVLILFVNLFHNKDFTINATQLIIVLIPFIIYGCFAILLIKKTELVVSKLSLSEDNKVANINISKNELLESVFIVVGIFLIVNALIKVPQLVFKYNHYSIISILLQTILAIYLVLGSKTLIEVINKYRK